MTSQDSVTCNGDSDGTATVLVNSGGTGSYTYLWDAAAGNQTTATATNLAAGTYSVTVSDLFLCDTTISVVVEEPDALIIASMSMDSVSCNGLTDGSASAVGISGGNGTNSFSWNTVPAQTTNPATNLGAGNYIVTVTDQKGCNTSRDTTVLELSLIHI